MTKEKALKIAREFYSFLAYYPKWNNDKEVVLVTVQKNGYDLKLVSKELRNNKEIVLAAVQQDGMALYYASDELRNDKEVVMAAIQKDERILQYASKKVILEIVSQSEFCPTLEQIEITLNSEYIDSSIKEVYRLRRDEWLANMEENKLIQVLIYKRKHW